ncbi:hypothetical protein E1176_10380 [Fulvivirga sp. RKSG066]|uniref:DUF6702 family protein n=1 Tax=Fulvivirga aurantia TaxID=2529383 RepID=UPI0012BC1547|nr:DUF6702 family protein [Fulvivirga aurantia]MTI21425.1 hypothetical protein [Fulvivirga aurantia]
MLQYFLSAVLLTGSFLHPIHVSVTDIEYDEDRKALEIASHIFLDDIEKHIRIIKKERYLDILKPDKDRTTDDLISEYLKDRIAINVNGKPEEYKYLGFEREAGAIYVYMEVEKVRKLKSLEIRNEVLLDLYEDQINLVHVKVDGKIRSLKLEENNEKEQLSYE